MRALARSLRLLAWQPAAVLLAGLALALLAEVASIGLIGLSGWFVVTCYVSGITPLSTFSYLAPSGGVRSFAIARIGGRYSERLVTHSATLRWLTRIRVRMFQNVAAAGVGRLRQLSTGQALDRAMSDADTLDAVLIRAVLPWFVTGAGVIAGTGVISAVSGPAGIAFAAGALATTAIALNAGQRQRGGSASVATARGAARADIIAAVDSWEEMVSLGAVDRLRATAASRLASFEAAQAAATRSQSLVKLVTDGGAAITAGAVLAAATLARPAVSAPDALLIVLLAAGLLELMAALPAVARAVRDGAAAATRLDAFGAGSAVPGPASAAITPVQLKPAGVVIVSGRSGSGKTTLLRAIADQHGPGSPAWTSGRAVFVAHDDYLFAGSVADNLRLADPGLTTGQIDELLASMDLTARGISARTAVGAGGRQLSGGERRRLCLARAIASQPELLVLDEPTEGVDLPTGQVVLTRLRALLPGTTIVAAIHDKDLAVAAAFGDIERVSLDDHFRQSFD
jgi:ATP-binding cassette, subfamily C, bacterial CydC